ncbi:MAG: efflux RND transporter permease subunit [Sphaerochaetaceae bacterium]|nr:efflux RND transporter permease subunit [Sphaerochaetaceae bacterium]MDC7244109.1 efflux RND transporter permease subunit [Sphaerochaetaceae bacterium]
MHNQKGFSIGRFSVTKPVMVNILMITVLLLGGLSLARLPQEQFAEIPFFWVNVIVPYPGVGSEDLESSVTIPVENAFQGMDKLKKISSTTSEGLSVVRVEFDDGITQQEFNSLYQEAQTRFSQVVLPDGVLDPIVDDFSSADFLPVIEVVISGDLPYEQLREQAKSLQNKILNVKDVADVELVGLPERQILINLDNSSLISKGLSVNEVVRAISDQNSAIPSGTLNTGSREYLLRTLGSIDTVSDFESVIIRRSSDTSGMVRVSDVAQVVDGFDPDSSLARFNGNPSVNLRVIKVVKGNSVDIVDGVTKIVEEAQWQNNGAAQITLFNDSTVQIASSLNVLSTNAIMGLFLLVLILWLFIGLRNALITALGIPVTFALTFLVLDLLGETINTNTLFGLVLVLGLIVDHAIVIIENSYRLQSNGLLRHDAAIDGANQVIWPVVAATATTVAAFLPLMLLPGTIGKFLRVIPLTVTIALIVSTAEALFFLPSHYAEWGPRENGKKKKESGTWFIKIQNGYSKLFSKVYQFKIFILLIAIGITIGVFSLVGTLRQDLFSAEDYSYFNIEILTPRGTSLDETNKIVAQYENILLDKVGNGEITSISTKIGTLGSGEANSTQAQITVDLSEIDEGRTRSIDEIINEVQNETYYLSGVEQVFFRKAQNGPPTSSAFSFQFSGDEYNKIVDASNAIVNLLNSIDGVTNVESDFISGSPELRIKINQERASALGINVSSVGSYIRARFDNITAGTFFEKNEQIDIVVRFDTSDSRQYENLEQLLIPTDDGRQIPLSSIATVELDNSLGSIRRVEGKREITVSANAVESLDLQAVNQSVKELWDNSLSSRYPDVTFKVGGEFDDFSTLIFDIIRVFILGIFLIYLILGTQFNSYTQPLLILFSIPFAFIGVVLYLFISGTPLSTTVIYSSVALAGIAVNDAIVLISFINELRSNGTSVKQSVAQAAKTRLRPIILTSLTTIVGLLPTAIGIGGYSVVWSPMASTIIFGLIFSTLTTLFIIPMLYGTIYDRKKKRSKS